MFVDLFEAADEVEHFAAGVGAAGGGAEVGAAGEGAVGVDEAAGGGRVEERTGTVGAGWEMFAAGGLERAGGEEGFAAGEIGGFAGEFEVAALRAEFAVAFDGAGGEVVVDGADLVESGVGGGRGLRLVEPTARRGRPPSGGAHD